MSKCLVKKYVSNALKKTTKEEINFDIKIPQKEFGDYASNVGLILCKKLKQNPKEVNIKLIESIKKSKDFKKYFSDVLELNGFLNFFLNPTYFQNEIKDILKRKEKYFVDINSKKTKPKIQIEFVSANPTGPLTLANARGAFYGNTLANILSLSGNKVQKEYYVNDVGNQIYNLGIAIIKAWKLNPGDYGFKFDEADVYKGGYINTLADIIRSKIKGDLNKYLKTHNPNHIGSLAVKENISDIKYVLSKKANIHFDKFFPESTLKPSGFTDKAFNWLVKAGFTYKKDGAIWLKTTEMFNDDKDRVLQRSEGTLETYFLSDIAYHLEKFSHRKFDLVIDIFGADHFTHAQKMLWLVDKMKETKLIKNTSELKIILMQFMSILKDGKPFRMSKRQGNFVFFNDFIDAVGKDAASFFILDRSNDTHLEFDYDLAIQKSEQNPVYYTQYAYARICSILKKVKISNTKPDLSLLTQPQEISLIKEVLKLKDLLEEISNNYEVHSLTKYVVQLAKSFHSFYQACPIIQSDKKLQASRIALLNATKITLELCFEVMNIQAKNKM